MFKFRCNKEHILWNCANPPKHMGSDSDELGCVRELGTRPIPPGRQ